MNINFIDYFSTIIETLFFLVLSAGFLSKKFKLSKLVISLAPICIFKFTFIFLPVSWQTESLSSCINIILGILSIMILTDSGVLASIFCYILAYIMGFLLQIVLVAFVPLLGDFVNSDLFSLFGAVYTLVCAIIINHFFNLRKIYFSLFEGGKLITFLITNVFGLSFLFALYFKLNRSNFAEIILFILISFFTLVSINMVLINQLKRIRIQSAQLNAYEQYLPVLESLIQNVRIKQHNHTNEIQSIISLLHTCNDYDSLVSEMTKYINISLDSTEPDYLLKLNLHLVAGFLYHKKLTASEHGIVLEYNVLSYNLESKVPEYTLVELFGILIDNAIEATPKDGTVHITINSANGKIIFSTRNPGYVLTPDDRTNFFTKGYTTKSTNTNSGLGLYNLRDIVLNQYNGSVSLWNEGTDILFEIIV